MEYIIDTNTIKAEAYDTICNLIEAEESTQSLKAVILFAEEMINHIQTKGEIVNG